jgi:hypothetical protein
LAAASKLSNPGCELNGREVWQDSYFLGIDQNTS